MSENTFWLSLWLGIALAITTIVLACTYRSYKNDERMAEMGLCRTPVIGSSYHIWQKCVPLVVPAK